MELLRKNIEFLKGIRSMSKDQRIAVLRNVTPEQAKVIGDICVNILNKILSLSAMDKLSLRKHKLFIRFVGSKETSQKKRISAIKSSPRAGIAVILIALPKITRLVSQTT